MNNDVKRWRYPGLNDVVWAKIDELLGRSNPRNVSHTLSPEGVKQVRFRGGQDQPANVVLVASALFRLRPATNYVCESAPECRLRALAG